MARRGSQDFTGLVDYVDDYQPGAARFDVSERSNFALMPMLVAALEQILEWHPENVQAYCRELARGLIEEARALGFFVEEEQWRGAHLFGLRLAKGVDMPKVQHLLRERRIVVSVRGDAIRVAPNVYNDVADVQALAEVLRAAAT